MNKMPDRLYVFATVAKLVACFLLYQFAFVALGLCVAWAVYCLSVVPVSFFVFNEQTELLMQEYYSQGVSSGMLLSSAAMIAHLVVFKYVRIRRGFFREVRASVLLFSILFIGSLMIVFNVVAAALELENNMEGEIEQLLTNAAGVLSVAVFAPVLEELLFRGAIQGLLMRRFGNPWLGIVVAALLFGLIHGNPVQIFYASCLGVGFGWLYYRTGSLLPAIVGHIVNNSLAVVCGVLFGSEVGNAESTVDAGSDMATVVVAGAFCLLFVAVINHLQPRVPVPWHEAGASLFNA